MPSEAKLNARELLKALREQHFTVTRTKDGYRVTRSGKQTTFHSSTIDGHGKGYANCIVDLKKMGFVHPSVWEKRRKKQPQGEEVRGNFPCPHNCGAGPYPYARNLGRHIATTHNGEWEPPKPEVPATAKPDGTPAASPVEVKKALPEVDKVLVNQHPDTPAKTQARLLVKAHEGIEAMQLLLHLATVIEAERDEAIRERDEWKKKFERLAARLMEGLEEITAPEGD